MIGDKRVSEKFGLTLILLVMVGLGILIFLYQYFALRGIEVVPPITISEPIGTDVVCAMDTMQCPDGSFVSRIPPSCEFAACLGLTENWKDYKNEEYGFSLTFPETWNGYSVEKQTWQGQLIGNTAKKYSGVQIVIKNPQTTATQAWQDIPIMVFNKEIWKLVEEEKVAVSAAPIGPAKIGENANYVFATPPRWYGFTDAIGYQEAVDIVKTFKAF
ncbi:MAG TPA: hypothetical protein PLF16_01270 [Candidatus Staskawiczbacteria bacterium]|nr:hypothetical protein [Candidatus Staskawiczbacteria bacterium]